MTGRILGYKHTVLGVSSTTNLDQLNQPDLQDIKVGYSTREPDKNVSTENYHDDVLTKTVLKVTGHSKMIFFCMVSPISTRLFFYMT